MDMTIVADTLAIRLQTRRANILFACDAQVGGLMIRTTKRFLAQSKITRKLFIAALAMTLRMDCRPRGRQASVSKRGENLRRKFPSFFGDATASTDPKRSRMGAKTHLIDSQCLRKQLKRLHPVPNLHNSFFDWEFCRSKSNDHNQTKQLLAKRRFIRDDLDAAVLGAAQKLRSDSNRHASR